MLQVSDSGNFKTIVAFECRGIEPVAFDPRVSHAVLLVGSIHLTDSTDSIDSCIIDHRRVGSLPQEKTVDPNLLTSAWQIG